MQLPVLSLLLVIAGSIDVYALPSGAKTSASSTKSQTTSTCSKIAIKGTLTKTSKRSVFDDSVEGSLPGHLSKRTCSAAPTAQQFETAMKAKGTVPVDTALFYTGSTYEKAEAYASTHKLNMIQKYGVLGVTDGTVQYDDNDYTTIVNNWSEAFAKVSSGVVWVMYNSGDKISTAGDYAKSFWNVAEWPALKANSAVTEIIQLDSTGKSKGQQIYPKDVRDATGTCSWVGTAPSCTASCPTGTTEYTTSAFGAGTTKCTTGSLKYCCST